MNKHTLEGLEIYQLFYFIFSNLFLKLNIELGLHVSLWILKYLESLSLIHQKSQLKSNKNWMEVEDNYSITTLIILPKLREKIKSI